MMSKEKEKKKKMKKKKESLPPFFEKLVTYAS